MGSPHLSPLAWDTEFFGCPIGRLAIPDSILSPKAIEEGLDEGRRQGLACLYFEIPFASAEILSCGQKTGFYLVDLKTRLDKALNMEVEAEEDRDLLDSPRPEHHPALEAIADDLALRSRFHYDPHFGDRESRRLYREWLRKSLHENYCADFIVALEQEKLAGFLTTRLEGNVAAIDLLGVARQARGQGISSRLIRATQNRLVRRGFDRLSVATQGHNIAALRAYQKNGFEIRSVNVFYHIWLRELG